VVKAFLRRTVPRRIDALITGALFVALSIWATFYWQRITAHGQPFYYQLYFEPAVMIGCGKGLVVARPQIPEMVPFLLRQVDRFSCDAIPANAPLGTEELFQVGTWRYLMLAVGITWRIVGVSWSALGPLFGILFGATIAAAYLTFRLGMSPLLAVIAAVALRFSIMHLKYLPILRDYAKAPFALLLMFLMGLLVAGNASWKRVLTIAAAYGAVNGIAYGFRMDFTAFIPPFLVALALFLDGGPARNLALKAAAAALALATYLIAAWPVIATLEQARSGCGWHVILMGFSDDIDPRLGVDQPPYQWNREYLDEYAFTTVTSHAARRQPNIGHFGWCGTAYSNASRSYLFELATFFPSDLIVRALASIRRVVELPFSPVPGIDDDDGKAVDWGAGHGIGFTIVVAAIVLALAANLRIGLFLIFFLLYFGALPAIQFDHRHFFYLIFITWWAGGFLIQAAIEGRPLQPLHWLQAVAIPAGLVVAFALVLWAARTYQTPVVRALLSEYLSASREPIPAAQLASPQQGVRAAPPTDPETADFIVVDLNGSRCAEHAAVGFQYADPIRKPYGRIFTLPPDSRSEGLTHIFMPIYDGFGHLDLPTPDNGCVDGVYRVRDPRRLPLLLETILSPGWRRQPLYQRFAN
jgi:hypothetical protein